LKQKLYILTFSLLLTSELAYGQAETAQSVFEGYYLSSWENSAFYEKKGNNLSKAVWLGFTGSFKKSDTFINLLMKGNFKTGVYIKFEGKKTTGGNFGHLGASKELVTVSAILAIDTTKKLDNFHFKKNVGLNDCISNTDTLTGTIIYSFVHTYSNGYKTLSNPATYNVNGIPSGINLISEGKSILVYPNPLSSFVTIHFSHPVTNAEITIVSLSGQKVKHVKNISGETVTLQRDNLPGGLYFIQLIQDNQIITTKKLIITD
jgi:hypothetical protein